MTQAYGWSIRGKPATALRLAGATLTAIAWGISRIVLAFAARREDGRPLNPIHFRVV